MNCSNSTVDKTVQLVQLVVYIPMLLFGTTFNAMAVWVFCCKLKKWTETRVYMMNLVISDCSLLLILPFRIYSFRNDGKLGRELCSAARIIYFLNMYMSISVITLIAIDRYIAIAYPLKAKLLRSPFKATVISGLLWILQTALRVYLELGKTEAGLKNKCFTSRLPHNFPRLLYFAVFGFIVPFIILSFCTAHIIRTLKKKKNTSPQEEKSIEKVIHIVTANLTVFIICFSPIHIGNIIRFVWESIGASCFVSDSIEKFLHIARIVADSNCCFDAICYYFVAKEFWEVSCILPKSRNLQQQTQESKIL
ncbi:G-protein coupled receptor 35-like [Rhinatrema bivittatum]|uniref:G-protein coupled receptor 35-like n=1 Tax=Rhinatrema bivittatum TaxID=194408 RepID=UPI001129734E|nr:G-protein coupled receptor 35-like [Rhinatrema bivittatum]